jgi:DNA-binding XRE family transcriptional regulator
VTEVRAEAIWAAALVHPLRVRILRRMLEAHTAVPLELARWWEIDSSVMRRHFRRLEKLGLIARAERATTRKPRAYCLRDRASTEEALWRLGAPVPARESGERLAARTSAIAVPRRTEVERLRARREQVGLSRPQLARRIGIRPEMLGRIERGQIDPRLSVVLVLADELDYPPEELFASGLRPHAETCR